MAHRTITLEQLPAQMISINTLRQAFERCTPYDCASRTLLNHCYPKYSWDTSQPEDITMKHTVSIICYCLRTPEYLDRFALYFAGECVAPYEVLKEYLVQAFVKT